MVVVVGVSPDDFASTVFSHAFTFRSFHVDDLVPFFQQELLGHGHAAHAAYRGTGVAIIIEVRQSHLLHVFRYYDFHFQQKLFRKEEEIGRSNGGGAIYRDVSRQFAR